MTKINEGSSQKQEWTHPNQQPARHNFLYPNEYNPTPPKFKHNIADGNMYQPDFNQHNPDPEVQYRNQYKPNPHNIVGNIPDVKQFKPNLDKFNPVPSFKFSHQYNPTPPSMTDILPYHHIPNQNHPYQHFNYLNEHNPTRRTPKNQKTGIWDSRKRYKLRQGQRQRRPYRSRRPSPILHPRPCKLSIWGNYYGYYGT